MVEYLHKTERPSDRCMHPSKVCHKKRALKLNGKPHKYCEEHRQQANRNQKRLQERRRLRELQETQLYVLETFAQPSESNENVWNPHANAAMVDAPPKNDNSNGNSEIFWTLFDDNLDHKTDWTTSLGTLTPLRAEDNDEERAFTPEDIYKCILTGSVTQRPFHGIVVL